MPSLWLHVAVNGIAQDAENNRAGKRRAGPLAQLSQQWHHPGGDLAALTLQVPSGGSSLSDLPASGNLAHLPALWQARENVSFSRRSGRGREVGPVAVV